MLHNLPSNLWRTHVETNMQQICLHPWIRINPVGCSSPISACYAVFYEAGFSEWLRIFFQVSDHLLCEMLRDSEAALSYYTLSDFLKALALERAMSNWSWICIVSLTLKMHFFFIITEVFMRFGMVWEWLSGIFLPVLLKGSLVLESSLHELIFISGKNSCESLWNEHNSRQYNFHEEKRFLPLKLFLSLLLSICCYYLYCHYCFLEAFIRTSDSINKKLMK